MRLPFCIPRRERVRRRISARRASPHTASGGAKQSFRLPEAGNRSLREGVEEFAEFYREKVASNDPHAAAD